MRRLAAPAQNWNFCVYIVHKDDTEEVLQEHITDSGVIVNEICLKSHGDALFNSCKIVIAASDAKKVLDPAFWPRGVKVRKWYEPREEVNRMRNDSAVGGQQIDEEEEKLVKTV